MRQLTQVARDIRIAGPRNAISRASKRTGYNTPISWISRVLHAITLLDKVSRPLKPRISAKPEIEDLCFGASLKKQSPKLISCPLFWEMLVATFIRMRDIFTYALLGASDDENEDIFEGVLHFHGYPDYPKKGLRAVSGLFTEP